MGATHFKMKTMKHVATEMALHVLAYNMMRVMAILGVSRAGQGDAGVTRVDRCAKSCAEDVHR